LKGDKKKKMKGGRNRHRGWRKGLKEGKEWQHVATIYQVAEKVYKGR